MELGDHIKKVADDMFADGSMETIIREQLTKNITKIIDDSLSYGKLRDAFRDKIEECMLPAIKDVDMSKYVMNLDNILTKLVNETALVENNKILENFKNLMDSDAKTTYGETIKMSKIIDAYRHYIENDVDTTELETTCDDGPSYEAVEIEGNIEYAEDRSWSLFEHATMDFMAVGNIEDQADTLNRTIHLVRYKKDYDDKKLWRIESVDNVVSEPTIKSLRYMSDFDVFLIALMRAHVEIEIDEDDFSDEVVPAEEPELTFH